MLNGGENVVHQQLQAALPLIFIHIEPVDELHGAFRRGEGLRLLYVVEGDRIERSARSGNLRPHFQVTLADHPRIADREHAVETGLWKGLATRSAGAKRA